MTKKLEKVLEYLIAGKEDRAKDLLHQVFIEKARAIHEDLINMDEEVELDEIADEGEDLIHDVEDSSDELDELHDEIEAEETMSEDDDMSMDFADAGAEDDFGGDDFGSDDLEGGLDVEDDVADIEDAGDMEDFGDVEGEEAPDVEELADEMHDLEDALAALKAEFEKLEAGEEHGEEEVSDEEEAEGDEEEAEGDEEAASDEESEEEEMDESWLAEFDDLDESVHLDTVQVPHGEGEVGSGHYAPVETNKKSPVGKAPDAVMGAKPVKTGEGPVKSGFNKETAPSSKELPHTSTNRRKKAEQDTKRVSKEGDSAAKLNKATSDGFGEVNKKSPLSSSPRK